MPVVIFIIILATLVLVHEFGHFIAAKKQGVKVEEFGIGLPPRIFGIKKGETIYSLNIIPLGGFVRLYGEEYHEIKKQNQSKKAFISKKPWQKAVIVMAGVFGNFILGWAIMSFLFTQGVPVPTNRVKVEKVIAQSPAFRSGIKKNDVLESVYLKNQKYELKSSTDLIALSQKHAGEVLKIRIERNGETFMKTIVPRKNPPQDQGPLGVVISSHEEKKYPWYLAPFFALFESVKIVYNIAQEMTRIIFNLATHFKVDAQVSGPIGIAVYTASAIKFGKNAVLELMAILSFNLAIINILPFPALDGGRMVFVLYEWITGKSSNKNLERYTNLVGFFILISLAILITINDIVRIYR